MQAFKYIIAILLHYSGIIFLIKRLFCFLSKRTGFVVLLYHRVGDWQKQDGIFPEMIVSPSMFFHQLLYIKNHFTPVPLSEYLSSNLVSKPRSRIRVMITFDDGWRDNYDYAYPILKKHNFPATIFLVSDYVGTTKTFWPERLLAIITKLHNVQEDFPHFIEIESIFSSILFPYQFNLRQIVSKNSCELHKSTKPIIERLKLHNQTEVEHAISQSEQLLTRINETWDQERVLLNKSEINEMSDGIIEFGSHTCKHFLLDRIDKELMKKEIINSKKTLEEMIKKEVDAFAYPNGNYNKKIIEVVKDAGYKAAFTTQYGVNTGKTPQFELKRIRVDENFSKNPMGKFSKCLFEFQIARNMMKS